MKIKKLYIAPIYHDNYVLQDTAGSFYRFYDAPARMISESDLTPVPFYRAQGNNAKEAPEYIYKIYGLQKMEDKEMKITWNDEKIKMTSSYGEPREIRKDFCFWAINLTNLEDEDLDVVDPELYAEVDPDDYLEDDIKEKFENGEIDADEWRWHVEQHQDEMAEDLERIILKQADELGIPAEAIAFDW